MIAWLRDIPRQHRFAPRVDNNSLVLVAGAAGEAEVAKINDTQLQNQEVMIWQRSGVLNRPISTGVTNTQLQVLNGATAGTAVGSKALVVGSTRNIANINALGAKAIAVEGLYAQGVTAQFIQVEQKADIETLEVAGFVAGMLRLGDSTKVTSRRSAVDYDVISRDLSVLVFGNATESIRLRTNPTADLIHRKGTVDHKIWDASNGGHNSGMNADMVDGVHASQFLRSDVLAVMNGVMAFNNDFVIRNPNLGTQNIWRVRTAPTNYYLDFFSEMESITALRLHRNGNAEFDGSWLKVAGNDVMHKGNDGAGSGFDVDLLDGQHGDYYRNQANITGATGTGVLVRESRLSGYDIDSGYGTWAASTYISITGLIFRIRRKGNLVHVNFTGDFVIPGTYGTAILMLPGIVAAVDIPPPSTDIRVAVHAPTTGANNEGGMFILESGSRVLRVANRATSTNRKYQVDFVYII